MMNAEVLSLAIQAEMLAQGFIQNEYTDFKPIADAIANAVVAHIQAFATVSESGGVQ